MTLSGDSKQGVHGSGSASLASNGFLSPSESGAAGKVLRLNAVAAKAQSLQLYYTTSHPELNACCRRSYCQEIADMICLALSLPHQHKTAFPRSARAALQAMASA